MQSEKNKTVNKIVTVNDFNQRLLGLTKQNIGTTFR